MRLEKEIPDPELSSFQYIAFGLSGCSAADYLERSEELAWALVPVMRSGAMSRAGHELACLRSNAVDRLEGDGSSL